MAVNLKNDLLNKLTVDRQFKEVEFVRLANEPNMNYEDKINSMLFYAKEMATIDLQLNVINFYFKDQTQQTAQPAPAQNGQSHHE